MKIQLKRIYDAPEPGDGYRILVDRLWPRGVSKERAQLDLWLKEIGPSHELRKWFNHDPEKFTDFKGKYKAELEKGQQKEAYEQLEDICQQHGVITLLFATKSVDHNHAVLLKSFLFG